MQPQHQTLVTAFIIITCIVTFMATMVINFFFIYKKREKSYSGQLRLLESEHEKTILASRLEMQENTQQHISREIHDNINLSLTLAKLYLNTISWQQVAEAKTNVNNAVETLTKSIADLTNVSRNLNADTITSQGLIAALRDELERIRCTRIFTIDYIISGNPVYLSTQKDLIIFRIIQECFNNIIKHARATHTYIRMDYSKNVLDIYIGDNGKGFISEENISRKGAGLHNIKARTILLEGQLQIKSEPGEGTIIQLTIPI